MDTGDETGGFGNAGDAGAHRTPPGSFPSTDFLPVLHPCGDLPAGGWDLGVNEGDVQAKQGGILSEAVPDSRSVLESHVDGLGVWSGDGWG
jgi:hypothetical protein